MITLRDIEAQRMKLFDTLVKLSNASNIANIADIEAYETIHTKQLLRLGAMLREYKEQQSCASQPSSLQPFSEAPSRGAVEAETTRKRVITGHPGITPTP